ncbi:oligosaccharide repeat unit polymerase [Parabacteroides goldsteinii]|uniref:oligosaccharide repeat unit polymerase n=2 Tax=Parabacteroides goldsteinii TaxID=328812 RepID=UPI002165CB85|nr:oligosaccharide repeat unit polymerase [Parabacteroides goldsteinii]MCS2424465.1 oligosaccharide repeat unit polymerase [Parabacteroides goldsteinii]
MYMTILFVIIVSIMVLYQRWKEGNWVNLISVFMGPYIPLVFLNNFFVYKNGFDKINDDVLVMILTSFIVFFSGSLLFKVKKNSTNKEEDNVSKLSRYDFKKMRTFLIFIGLIGIVKIIILYLQGSFSSNIDDVEGVMGGGAIGHLLLASYSLLPIYFMYWTYNRKLTILMPIILIMIVTFSSFVKYNIIGLFVSFFLFLALYRKSVLKRSLLILVSFVGVVFYVNYAISFVVVGNDMTTQFILNHFWMYIAGSLIYDNYIFLYGIRPGIGVFYKLGTFIFALPNMFLEKTFDFKLFPHVRQEDLSISDFGETSNVVDAIGYLYPSKCDVLEVIIFYVILFILGALMAYIYKKHMKSSKYYDVFIVNFLCYFVFFSFFGTFYINSAPWEILIYSIFIPKLFIKNEIKN